MNICIVKSSSEFKTLLSETGLSETVLAGKIGVWQKNNNTYEYPKASDIVEISEEDSLAAVKEIHILNNPDDLILNQNRILDGKSVMETSYHLERFFSSFNAKLLKRGYQSGNAIALMRSFVEDSETFSSLFNEISNEIRAEIKEYKKDSESTDLIVNEEYIYLAEDENFDKLISIAKDHFKRFQIEFNEEAEYDKLEKTSKDNIIQKDQIKINPKTKASNFIKYLLSTLPSSHDNPLFENTKRMSDFGLIYTILANRLANVQTLEGGLSTLKQIVKDYRRKPGNGPDISAATEKLIQRLFSTFVKKNVVGKDGKRFSMVELSYDNISQFSDGHLKMLLEFFGNFNNNFNLYRIMNMGENGYVAMIKTERAAQKQSLMINARSTFAKTFPLAYESTGLLMKFKIDKLKSYGVLVGTQNDQLEKVAKDSSYSGFLRGVRGSSEYKYSVAKGFMYMLGFNLPDYNSSFDFELVDSIYQAANQIHKRMLSGVEKNLFSEQSDSIGNLNTIIDFIIQNDPTEFENSFVTSSGERVYSIALHSTLSRVINSINTASSLKELRRLEPQLFTTYTSSSQILKKGGSYFDSNGNRRPGRPISMSILSEIGSTGAGKDGKEFDKAPPVDKMMSTFNASNFWMYPIFRAGDNQVERFLSLSGNLYYNDNQILEYLSDELAHVVRLYELKDSDGVAYTHIDYNNIDSIMADYPVIDMLSRESPTLKSAISEVISGQLNYNDFLTKYQTNIVASFITHMSKMTDALFDSMVSSGAIQKVIELQDGKKETIYNRKLLYRTNVPDTEEFTSITEEDAKKQIRKSIINQAFARIEQTKLFTGPLVYYEGNDKFYQRMSALVGTKRIGLDSPLTNRIVDRLTETKEPSYWQKELHGDEGVPEMSNLYFTYSEEDNGVVIDNNPEGSAVVRLMIASDPVSTSYMLKDISRIIADSSAYQGMDIADAFAYASLPYYKKLMIRSHMWTTSQERLYQWLMRPNKNQGIVFENPDTGKTETILEESKLVNPDGSRTVFTVIKPQHFGPLLEEEFPPTMHKLSIMPILPEYVERYESFRTIQKTLDVNNAGIFTFPTANKFGTRVGKDGKVPSTYKPVSGKAKKGTQARVDLSDAVIQDTLAKNWGIQLSTGYSVKEKNTTGSQLAKLIFFNIYENGVVKKGKEAIAGKAEEVGLITRSLIEIEIQNLIEEFGIELLYDELTGYRYKVQKPDELINFLIRETEKRDVPPSTIDALEIVRNNWSRLDALKFDILSNKDKLENILAAIADSRIISRKTKGSSKVQASSVFFEKEGIKRYANNEAHLLSGTLKFYEDGVMEVMMPHWFKEFLPENLRDQFGSDELLLKDIQENMPELLNVVGFRIPTSGLNSIEAIRIVGFLPQSAGETIVVPAEIVAKAGSDFDVDKLNLFFANYRFDENTGRPYYIKYVSPYKEDGSRKTTMEFLVEFKKANRITDEDFIEKNKDKESAIELVSMNSLKALENGRLENIHYIVSHPSNRKDLLESIGINLIKEEEERIVGKQDKKTSSSIVFDADYNNKITQRNIDSKSLTGVAALHVVDHMHAMRYDYKVAVNSTFNSIFPEANYETDIDPETGKEILYLSLSRQNSYDGKKITTILNQMLNAAVDGVKDPIFYNLNVNLQTSSVVFLLVRGGVPLSDVFDFITNPFIKRFTELLANSKSASGQLTSKRKDLIDKVIEEFNESNMSAAEISRNEGILQFYDKLDREGAASKLNNYMQATRIDTQAMGKNTTQLEIILRAAELVEEGFIGIVNAEKLLQGDGFLAPHYKALKSFKGMYSELFFLQSEDQQNISFKVAYQEILDYVLTEHEYATLDEKSRMIDLFKNFVINYITLTSKNIRIGDHVSEIPIYLDTGLFSKPSNTSVSNTVASRINKAKGTGLKDNMFIKFIKTSIGTKPYLNVNEKGEGSYILIDTIYPSDQRFDPLELTAMQDSFEELFSNDWILENDPDLPYDIIKMIFLQGGIDPSPLSLAKFIPPKYYMQAVASAYRSFEESSTNNMYLGPATIILNFFTANYNNRNMFPSTSEFDTSKPKSIFYKTLKRFNISTTKDRRKYVTNTELYLNLSYLDKEASESFKQMFSTVLSGSSSGQDILLNSNTVIDFANITKIILPSRFLKQIPSNTKATYYKTLEAAEAKRKEMKAIDARLKKKRKGNRTAQDRKDYAKARFIERNLKNDIPILKMAKKRNPAEAIKKEKSCR